VRLRPETLDDYRGVFEMLVRRAPDKFVPIGDEVLDQRQALRDGFDDLREGIHFARKKIRDERQLRILQELFDMAYEAYLSGDSKAGADILQEAEGMIWAEQALPPKHVVEAERRACGVQVLYARPTG
jgi:hypothetical protein